MRGKPKAQAKGKVKGKKGKVTAIRDKEGAAGRGGSANEDWLGEAGDDEELAGPSDDEEDPGEERIAESSEEEEPGEGEEQGAPDEPADGEEAPRHRSKMLARVVSGQQPADIGAIRQRIQDSATLLGNWRKAQQMGEKRKRAVVLAALVVDCSTYYGYSEELAEYFLRMFSPEQAVQFFEANEKSRPLTIRTNSLKARRAPLMQTLAARKVQVDPVGPWTKVGLKVYESAVPIGATPEYLAGQYMIQSASSFIPVMALAPQQDELVLDMAAAPGGKTTYIGQLMKNTGTLFANDLRKERCKALVANVHRMGLTNVIVTNYDGRKLGSMLPRLDRVLLDAPCSGSGIISRDPSVKVKRGTQDFEEASRMQKELLLTAIDMVNAQSKTGGYIVYSTCSISVEENEAVVQHALQARSVELVSFSSSVDFGVEGLVRYRERRFHPTMGLCRRYYPHVHNMDGFFVAKLKKTSNKVPERTKKDRSRPSDHVKVLGEDQWTPEMMETVLDFPPPGSVEDKKLPNGLPKKAGRPLNKRERKRIRREGQRVAKAASATAAGAAVVAAANAMAAAAAAGGTAGAGAAGGGAAGGAAAVTPTVGEGSNKPEPEEEPQPPKPLEGEKKEAAAEAPGAAAAGEKAPKAKKKLGLRKKQAPATTAGDARPDGPGKKKRRKSEG